MILASLLGQSFVSWWPDRSRTLLCKSSMYRNRPGVVPAVGVVGRKDGERGVSFLVCVSPQRAGGCRMPDSVWGREGAVGIREHMRVFRG